MGYKVAVVSLGCPKNQVDAEQMLYLLKNAGFEIGVEEAEADAIIINTCGFIEDAKREAIENILEAARFKESGNLKALVVTGCLAERYKDDITKEIPEADVVVGLGSHDNIAEIVKSAIEGRKANYYGEKTAPCLNTPRILGGYPFSAYIKIADGCNNCCTYCAIPLIRGKMRSRKIEDIVSEAKTLAESGVKELIVVAQDTTAYGEDIYGERKLPELLRELCKIEGLHWIRTLYTYPEKITDELIDTVASEEKLVKYFDMPLQHINAEILKKMNRRGSKEEITALIEKIREKIPDVTLRTTLITGFPGETEEQFTELCEFVKSARFDRLGCFAYSPEEDTIAASMEGQLEEQLKIDRADIIMTEQATVSAQKNEEKIGKTAEVLIEGYDDYIRCYFGRSSYDAPEIDGKVFFTTDEPLVLGEFVKVKINDCMEYDLLGDRVK
ncbi:MAG: 30S ribosomal protein S12 methylthiotransferase RimO [Clostridiales bacterium]|nr:30S ribosomal protein S12 methylthiotransferase RimO [Candidatus Equinaster intestinalis]